MTKGIQQGERFGKRRCGCARVREVLEDPHDVISKDKRLICVFRE